MEVSANQERLGIPAAPRLRAKHLPVCAAAIRRRLSSLTLTLRPMSESGVTLHIHLMIEITGFIASGIKITRILCQRLNNENSASETNISEILRNFHGNIDLTGILQNIID